MAGCMTLEDRIRAAFADDAISADVAALLDEVRVAVEQAEAEANREHEAALDPTLSARLAAEHRNRAREAAFARDRVHEAAKRLTDQLKRIRYRGSQARRQTVYDAAREARDWIARKLADRWPKIEAEIVKLLTDLDQVESQVAAANKALPDNQKALLSAELQARGLKSLVRRGPGPDIPSLLRSLKLPAFHPADSGSLAWPQARKPAAAPKPVDLTTIVAPAPVHLFHGGKQLEQQISAGPNTVTVDIARAAVAAKAAVYESDAGSARIMDELRAANGGNIPHPLEQQRQIATGRMTPVRLDLHAPAKKVAA
jgi:hypothetical protein